jgi:hypothetical protein
VKINAIRLVPSLLIMLVIAAAAVAASAADLSGTWNVDGSVYGNEVKYTLTLKQEGETLSGTARLQDKDLPVTGTIKDKAVTWKFEVVYQGAPLENVFTGTLTTDTEIEGTIAVAGVGGAFTAKRK